MKVSAPQFMSSSAPPPPADANANVPETPADPTAPPPPVEPPKPAVWPEWFIAVDNALIVLALLFAFLMGSFAARNSDVFRHLAAGQRLLNGTYSLGSDPFSYTGAEAGRPWVNQSWLFDLAVYAAYTTDKTGAVAVVLKAVVFAAAFGVLLWFRRPGQAGWPWAFAIVAGSLTAGAFATLRPVVFGTLFCSLLLLAVFRGDWTRRGRMLAILGGLSWLWGGFDSFALVAPLLLVVLAAAGFVQSLLSVPTPAPADVPPTDGQPTPTPAPAPTSSFDSPPAPITLLLAAAVSLLGILLNPTFVIAAVRSPLDAVAQLVPTELAFGMGDTLADDAELRALAFSVLSPDYWKLSSLGLHAGSVGLFLLVVTGALGLAVGAGRPPAEWLTAWVLGLVLCFLNFRFIPVFAVVAVPLLGGLFNGLSGWFRLGTTADANTRTLLMSSRLGRIVTVPVFLVLLALTVPGLLHPMSPDPAYNRHLEWRIAPDEALVRGVEQLRRWRDSGALAAEDRGLLLHAEFGDYAAWYAPAEPVFANTRYRYHAPELGDLIRVRNALITARQRRAADAPPPPPAGPVADKHRASYVVLGRANQQLDTEAVFTAIVDVGAPVANLTVLWHLDGRMAVVGRSGTPAAEGIGERLSRMELALDPVRLAFSPQSSLPEGPLRFPGGRDTGWLGAFLDRPPPSAGFTDEVVAYSRLAAWAGQQEEQRSAPGRAAALAAATGWPPIALANIIPPRVQPSLAELAIPLIVARSARLAVHQTPDEERAYYILAKSFQTGFLPEFDANDLARQRLTALARFTARVPAADQCPAYLLPRALEGWLDLFLHQFDLGQFDLARESIKKAQELVRVADTSVPETAYNVRRFASSSSARFRTLYKRTTGEDFSTGPDEFQFEQEAKKSGRNEPLSPAEVLKKMDEAVTRVVGRANEEWDKRTRGVKPGQRALAAAQFGLPGKGLDLLRAAVQKDAPDSGVPVFQLLTNLVALDLEAGRLEEADELLRQVESEDAQLPPGARELLLALKLTKLRRQGSYRQAMAVLDDLRGGAKLPNLTADQKTVAALLPGAFVQLAGAAAGPITALPLPEFRPPPNTRQEAVPALVAEFDRLYSERHPLIAGQKARLTLLADAQYFYQRGVLALLDGDMATARNSFKEVFQPQGVPLANILIVTQEFVSRVGQRVDVRQYMPGFDLLPLYLSQIDHYANPPPAPGGPK